MSLLLLHCSLLFVDVLHYSQINVCVVFNRIKCVYLKEGGILLEGTEKGVYVEEFEHLLLCGCLTK